MMSFCFRNTAAPVQANDTMFIRAYSGSSTTTTKRKLHCCPSLTHWRSVHQALSIYDELIELEKQGDRPQTFQKTICRPRIKNRQCKYLNDHERRRSKCEQQFSYVIALGHIYNQSEVGWHYIRMESGCKCVIYT